MSERSKFYQDYPEQVSEFTEKVLEGLEDASFFINEGADYDITFRRMAILNLKNWISGETLSDFSDEEFTNVLNLSIRETNLESLRQKGLADCMEDENGEIKYFLTTSGKKELGTSGIKPD